MKKYILPAFLIIILACASSYSQAKIFTENDNEVVVVKNDMFDIKLPANRTTGYGWMFSMEAGNPDGAVTSMGYEYEEAPSDGKVGVPGMDVWHFKAVKSGYSKLVFFYSKPWENGAPAKTITFNVNIE